MFSKQDPHIFTPDLQPVRLFQTAVTIPFHLTMSHHAGTI